MTARKSGYSQTISSAKTSINERVQRRAGESKLLAGKTLDSFDFTKSINAAQIQALADNTSASA